MLWFSCVCWIILKEASATPTPKVTNPPVSMTAYLDTWVSFHCEGEGEILVWQTNAALVTDEIKETRNITIHPGITTPGIVNSTLSIFAKPENDDLNIGCVVGNYGSFVFDSVGADLIVKGIRPVEDLIFNISAARISWNPPSFVFDDVISLLYRVTITNDTDNIVIEYVTVEREYEVSIDILNLCSIYTVNVTAFDETCTSDSSILREEYTGEYSAFIVEDNISVEETGNFTVEFTIKLEGNPRLCNSVITGYTHLNKPVDEDNHEREHDPESIETNDDIYITKYTVQNLVPQQCFTFDCLITDTLNNIKAIDDWNFTTNHVQDFTAYVHENGSIYVQCIFAYNSNASGCGLNFTEREDTTVTLYSVQINKIQGSVEASGYINLPVSGNLTMIAFDVLENDVSDKPAVIYNGLAEIEPVKPILTSIVNIMPNNTSSSYHSDSDSDSDSVQSTDILSVQVSSTPTTEVKSTKATNKEFIIIISVCVLFICFVVIIIIITGVLMFSKYQRTKQKQRKEVFEVVSPMTQDNPYAHSNDIVRVVRSRQLERSCEIMEESDHAHVDVFLDGHRPNPPSIPSHSPPHYSLSIPLIHPAVTQTISDTSSDTSSLNHRPSYRSQTSRSSEDDNLLRNDVIPYDDGDTTEDNKLNKFGIYGIPTNQLSQQFQEPALENRDMPQSGYHSTSTTEMEEIPSVTQKSTSVVFTSALSKDVVPSHYADIELSHRGGTDDPIQNKRSEVVYSTLIEQLPYRSSEESVTRQTDTTKNKFVYSAPQTNYPQGMCAPNDQETSEQYQFSSVPSVTSEGEEIVMQLPGVFEVNSTHSNDPKRQWDITPPQIVVGNTFDHFKSFEEFNHQFTDENDDCDESFLLFNTAVQERSPKAVEITTPIIDRITIL